MLSWIAAAMGLGPSVDTGDDSTGPDSPVDRSRSHFSVALTSTLKGGDDPQIVPFDQILSQNPTTAFDTNTYQFTCSIPGAYFFTYTIHSQEGKAASVALMKNEERQVLAYAHKKGNAPGAASQSAVLDLSAGDTAWLQLQSGTQYGILSHPGTPLVTFTGVLISRST